MLSTNRPHIHRAVCWFAWRNQTGKKRSLPHQHSQSTVPAIEWLFSPLFPLFFFFFDFCSVLQLFSVTKHPASRPLTLVSKQTERERVQGKGVMAGWGWWCGCEGEGWTRLLLLVTQTWLRASTSTMFALPHSLPPTERLSLPLSSAHALPPSLSPTEPVLCLHSALSKLLFWLKEVVVWPDGSVFSSDSTLSGSVGRMLVGALSGFKSGVVESSRLEGGLGRQQV